MNIYEPIEIALIEIAFKKENIVVDGRAIWKSIEKEILENIDGDGEFEIQEEDIFQDGKKVTGIVYTISKKVIKNGEDDYSTEIKLLKITINNKILFEI